MDTVCKTLAGIAVVGLGLIIFTPLGFPYSYTPESPICQRHGLVHTERNFYTLTGELNHTDSGVLITPMDYTGDKYFRDFVPEMKSGVSILPCREPYCGDPLIYPVIDILHPGTTTLIPGSRLANVQPRLKMTLTGRDYLDNDMQRLTFSVTGPDHITVYISPFVDVALVAWSIGDGVPEKAYTPSYTDRMTHFIYYSYGEQPSSPWTFYLDFQELYVDQMEEKETHHFTGILIDPNVAERHNQNLPILDIAFAGHYVHGKHNTTMEMENIIKKLPPWMCAMSFVSTFDSYQF